MKKLEVKFCYLYTFFLDGQPLTQERKSLEIQFPDGHREVCDLYWLEHTTIDRDMNAVHYDVSQVPAIKADLHGIDVTLRLQDLNHKTMLFDFVE